MYLKFTPFPTLVRYELISDAGGYQKGPFVVIDPKYRNDRGLHAHEYRHILHFYLIALVSLIVLWYILPLGTDVKIVSTPLAIAMYHVLMATSSSFRMWAEIDCYRRQLKVTDVNVLHYAKLYASWFSPHYKIHKDPEWILNQLLK